MGRVVAVCLVGLVSVVADAAAVAQRFFQSLLLAREAETEAVV